MRRIDLKNPLPNELAKEPMKVTSTGIDRNGKTDIVLYWIPIEGIIKYNLSCSHTSTISGESIHGSFTSSGCSLSLISISPVKTCEELKALITEGSREWEILKNAFTSVSAEKKHIIEPCDALKRGLTTEEEAIFDVLANINLKYRLARGLAYIHKEVEAHQVYTYHLSGIKTDGTTIDLTQQISVQAGHYDLPAPPSDFSLAAGDNKILATWERNDDAFSYVLRRAIYPNSGYQVVNDQPIFFDIEKDLQGNPISPPTPGFIDYQRWSKDNDDPDKNGLPISHKVNGLDIDGPNNGITYYYQVASCDILNRAGNWSMCQSATPKSQTPPMAPTDFRIDYSVVRIDSVSSVGLTLSWRKVTRDINNHQIIDKIQEYRIYRADTIDELNNINLLPIYCVHRMFTDPTDLNMTLSWRDTDPMIIPAYGEKDFYYRLQCFDINGNAGSPSAVLSGRIPDTTPPGSTKVVEADSKVDHIRIHWLPNTEPDMAGYQIYRSVCNKGKFYRINNEGCNFILVGTVSLNEAKTMFNQTGYIYYDDYSISTNSPICYAYWVRAFDIAQNLYVGKHGCPADIDEYVCQRLYEGTPPPVPIITGLKAKNNAVLIEWIASPVQDMHAFHVYRSEKENEKPIFLGCVLTDGTLTDRWRGITPDCEDIPAEPFPNMTQGFFVDEKVEANRVYWYRISALDWLGNESEGKDIRKIPAISTFTYSKDLPITPSILPQERITPGICGILIRWNPPFEQFVNLEGFIVYRSISAQGGYRQISSIVKGNSFSDKLALHETDYWYCVQSIDKTGKISVSSIPVHHRY